MKKILFLSVLFVAIFCFGSVVHASNNQQTTTLKAGWNIVSTPKILINHEFSVAENSTNLDIYVMNPSSPSGWQTMQGIGQTEFQPLYAYFINNKTGSDQTLTFNYNLNLNPSERLFSRVLNHGWNTIGIASSSYALSQYQNIADTNNPSNILNSIIGSIDSIIDFTYGNSPYYSPQVSTTWVLKTPPDINSLNDFRELKGYGVYVSGQAAVYNGYQNINEVEQPNTDLATVSIGTVLPSSNTTTDPANGVRVWESNLTVGIRSVNFTKLSLKQINSIDKSDIGNFQLLVDGTLVSTVASLDSNGYATFTFNKILATGARNIKVLADVTGGSSRYVQMSLRNKDDIDIKDAVYDVSVITSFSSATAATIHVNEGSFNIIADNASLPETVANGSSNVLLGKWKFTASGESIKVEGLKVGFNYLDANAGGNIARLRNGKILINGSQSGSTTTLVSEGTEYLTNYTFQPGIEKTIEIYADIYDNDGVGVIEGSDTIQAKLVVMTGNGTRQISLGTINVPLTEKLSNPIQVISPSATLTATPNYGTQNTVLPQTAFKVGSWTLTAGTAEDININGFSFAIATLNAHFDVTAMSDMYVTYQVGSGSAVTTSVTPTPTSPATFSPSFTLPKGQTATINLYASLNNPGAIVSGNSVQATLTVTGSGSQSGAAASITPRAGQIIINADASLTISKNASTPVATLVAGNNTVKTVSYKFEALNDSYTISQLTFLITDPSAVSSVNLKDGSTILASAPASTSVIFNLSTPVSIAANTYKIIDVEVVLGNIGTGMGTSSANVATKLSDALIRPSSTGTARLLTSGEKTALVSGNAIYVYKAIPTITLSTLPSGNLASGTNTISKFTIGSDTGTIAWKKISFAVSKSDASGGVELGAISNVQLWNGSTQVIGTAIVPAGTLGTTGSQTGVITFIPTSEEQVAGSTTYTLKANVGGTVAIGDSINTRIDASSTVFADSTAFSLVNENASFVWSDLSRQSHSVDTSDWTGDFLVKNLPTDTQNLTK